MSGETTEATARGDANSRTLADSIRSNYPIPTSDFDYSADDPRTGKPYTHSWPLTARRIDEALSVANPSYCILREMFGRKLKVNDVDISVALESGCSPPFSCNHCVLKISILADPDSTDRNFVQQECFERLKYLESQSRGYDIGKEQVEKLWFEEGFYSRFRNAYRPDKSIQEIFDGTVPGDIESAKKLVFEQDPLLADNGKLEELLAESRAGAVVAA